MSRAVNPTHRTCVSYIDKSREYYAARGYANPYRWACFDDAPVCRSTATVVADRRDLDYDRSSDPRRPRNRVAAWALLGPRWKLSRQRRGMKKTGGV
jgi:hypothetical protein